MTYIATPEILSITETKSAYLVQMPSQFTMTEASSFKQYCEKICQTGSVFKKIILDFGQTTFMDSSGLLGLCQIVKAVRETDNDVTFWSFSPQVKMILSLAGLDEVFQVENINEKTDLEKKNKNLPLELNFHPSVVSKTKRFLDICGAVVGLVITGMMFIPIAIAVKLDSPGPILFSQTRCGHMGKKFRIWKFRSMISNASDLKYQVENKITGPLFKNENDPRITKVGRFLRKTSLDEFPQFWNILIGEMSLVGTRPPTCDEVEKYEVNYAQRLDVKPGLTGEWQVNGRSEITDFAEVLRLDLQYQKNWSVWYDIKLIMKTIRVVVSGKSGAC